MVEVTGPGTIDQLVADAAERGHQINARVIRDWTQAGLLDYPERRPAGKGHGSHHALYPENQRNLLLTLLHHRPSNGIRSLARIPVGIWMYWGDQFVALRQVRRAMDTWLGDPRASKRQARETAQEVLRQLDNPAASAAARRDLLETVSTIAYTGRADLEQLERSVRVVFEPDARQIRRAVGHPAAPVTAESMIELIKARFNAVERLKAGKVTDQEFNQARHAHLVGYAEYAMNRHQYASMAPANNLDMYEPVTAEIALNSCCGHLLTTVGLQNLHPEQAARINAQPTPKIQFGQ
jgi:hypothetical protein